MAPGPCMPWSPPPGAVFAAARGADVCSGREADGASAQTGDIVRRLHGRWDAAAEGVHLGLCARGCRELLW